MKTKNNTIDQPNLLRIAIGTASLLLIPLVARWPWTVSDFIIMGMLIFGTGVLYEVVIKKMKKYRMMLSFVLLIAFLLIWAELAVGIFGTPFAGN